MPDAPVAAPAPASPAAPSPAAFEPSPLAAATEAARTAVADTGTLPGADLPEVGGEEAAPPPATPEPTPTPEPEPEPTPEPEPEPASAEGEEQEEGAEPEATDTSLIVALPGRHPHDPPVEIEVTDPEVAERLRQLNNGYLRGEEVRAAQAQTEQEWSRIAEVEEAVQLDPVGFIERQLPAQYAPRIALQLLADPKVLDAVRKDLTELLTPATSRTKLAELRAEKYETREVLQQARVERQAGERNASEVRSAVAALIPPEYDAEKAGRFLHDALTELGEYATRHALDRLDVEQVPVLLAQRLQRAGINPVQAAARLSALRQKTPTSRPGAPAQGRPVRGSGPKAAAAPTARPTGKTFVDGDAKKRAVAKTAPAGAGAPRAPVAPPKGTTLKEATALARRRMQ